MPVPARDPKGPVDHGDRHDADDSVTGRCPSSADVHQPPHHIIVDAAHAAVARATAREIAVHQTYDRARNVLRARNRRHALVQPAREMFSTPERLDAYVGRSMPSCAWGLPVSRRGHLLAVISPTASAITVPVAATLGSTIIVVASVEERERIIRVTQPRQRFALLSVRVPEPTHEEIVEFARRNPDREGVPR